MLERHAQFSAVYWSRPVSISFRSPHKLLIIELKTKPAAWSAFGPVIEVIAACIAAYTGIETPTRSGIFRKAWLGYHNVGGAYARDTFGSSAFGPIFRFGHEPKRCMEYLFLPRQRIHRKQYPFPQGFVGSMGDLVHFELPRLGIRRSGFHCIRNFGKPGLHGGHEL